jgi:hypothetical protein
MSCSSNVLSKCWSSILWTQSLSLWLWHTKKSNLKSFDRQRRLLVNGKIGNIEGIYKKRPYEICKLLTAVIVENVITVREEEKNILQHCLNILIQIASRNKRRNVQTFTLSHFLQLLRLKVCKFHKACFCICFRCS